MSTDGTKIDYPKAVYVLLVLGIFSPMLVMFLIGRMGIVNDVVFNVAGVWCSFVPAVFLIWAAVLDTAYCKAMKGEGRGLLFKIFIGIFVFQISTGFSTVFLAYYHHLLGENTVPAYQNPAPSQVETYER